MTSQRRLAAVFAASTALVLAACSGGGGGAGGPDGGAVETDENGFASYTGDPQEGGVVTVLGGVDFSHLDPAMGNDGNVNNLYQLIYRNLTTYRYEPGSEQPELVPDLATDLGTSNDDATVWTFTLKEGVTFQDGSPITAEDVKFGIERAFDPSLAIGSDYLQTYIEGALDYPGVFEAPEGLDSIRVVDERTIEFHLNQPLAAFPYVLATPPGVPFPADQVTSPQQIQEEPIASGPYRVESYERGEALTLVRNEEWDRETDEVRPARPDGFEFLLGLDQNTIDQRMLSGQGEDANALASSTNPLLAATLSRVQQDPRLMERTIQDLPTCTMYMAMNTTVEPLNDPQVRQAINYAVDKTSVVNATGGPLLATTAHDMLLPSVPGREEFNLYETPDDAGDPQRARQMLADAGHPNGFDLTMDVRAIPKWQAQAEAVQQSLAQVGINVRLNVIDAATYYEAIATTSQQNDLAITGWCSGGWYSGAPLLGPLFDGDRITETGNTNIAQLDDEHINARFDEIAQITDLDQQNAEYAELNREIMELAPVVPLVRETPLQMVGENIGGAFAHPARTGYIDYGSVGLLDPEG
ncbi:ABC transporter substrate-binding protein [Georgenia alba]|uniref:ABC transporter substrate-binding protein n=1 Tax=Georgenia alba TaxID=2233858 RepID=A0ABW2QCT8_9MICO